MYIHSITRKVPLTVSGDPIQGRIAYVFELDSPKAAEYCVASLTMSVRMQDYSANLYAKGNLLYLDMVQEREKPELAKQVENTIKQMRRLR